MVKNKKSSILKRLRNKLGLLLLVAALMTAGYLLWNRYRADDTPSDTSADTVNMDPATETEKQENDQHKEDIARGHDEGDEPTAPDDQPKTVTPVIVDASQYGDEIEVAVMVNGIIEDGGTCKATLTRNGQTVTKQTTGAANASSTSCPTIVIPRDDFPSAGQWSLTVTYTSAAAKGNAQGALEVE